MAGVTIKVLCEESPQRIVWVYRRNGRDGNAKLHDASKPIKLSLPSSEKTCHYGIMILKVEHKGDALREDGHAVIAVSRSDTTQRVCGDLVEYTSDFEACVPAKFTTEVNIDALTMLNPPNGKPWTSSPIIKTGAVINIICDANIVAWDTRKPYANIALQMCKACIKVNNSKVVTTKDPDIVKDIKKHMGPDVSLCGFARTSSMQLSWHSMPTPGFFGITEALPIAITPELWTQYVEYTLVLCGYNQDAFTDMMMSLSKTKNVVPLNPTYVNKLVTCANKGETPDNNTISKLLNCLEALAGIAVSVMAFTAQWKNEKYDNIVSIFGKLGMEQDCEDQAAATVAVIGGIKGTLAYLMENLKANSMPQVLAYLIGTYVESSRVVFGLVDEHIAKGKGGDHKRETTVLQGHGWCAITFSPEYRSQRTKRTYFVESTCPYFIHPTKGARTNPENYTKEFDLLYGKSLTVYNNETLMCISTYKTPQLQPEHRYKYVAFTCDAVRSFYIGQHGQTKSNYPFLVGVTAEDYKNNTYCSLPTDDLLSTFAKKYNTVFKKFVFHPCTDIMHKHAIQFIIDSNFMHKNGNYKFSPKQLEEVKKTLESLVNAINKTPTESVSSISAYDWVRYNTKITDTLAKLTPSPNFQIAYCIHQFTLNDQILIGNCYVEQEQTAADNFKAVNSVDMINVKSTSKIL